jgi:hypothetical protein
MPELEPPQSIQSIRPAESTAATSGAAPGGAQTAPAPDIDALTQLKKMSTTAGLGSGDYVAISRLAVVALLAGLASVLVLILGGGLLLLIPAAGVVCALIAFYQIRHSNGTLTGRAIAGIGLVLSLLIGGGVLASQIVAEIRYKPDRAQIAGLIRQLGQEVAAAGQAERSAPPSKGPVFGPTLPTPAELEAERHYDAAYKLFSDKFRDRVDETKFRSAWTDINKSADSALVGMEWNGNIEFDDTTGKPVAWAMALLKLNKSSQTPREPVEFVKTGGTWKINDIPQIFREEKTQKPSSKGAAKGPAT